MALRGMSGSAPAFRQLVNASRSTVSAVVPGRLHSNQRGASHSSARSRNIVSSTNSRLLPEFSLKNKVVVVSGGARGLGLVQAEALLEAGATGLYSHLVNHGNSSNSIICIQTIY